MPVASSFLLKRRIIDKALYSLSASSSILEKSNSSFLVSMMNADFVWVGIITDLLFSEKEKSASLTLNMVSRCSSQNAVSGMMNRKFMNAT